MKYKLSWKNLGFKEFVIISIAGHLIGLVVLNFDGLWLSEDDLIVKNAIRVDMVGLPDKKKALPKIRKKKSKAKIVKKKKKKKPVKKKKNIKKKQNSAFEKLKALEKKTKQQAALDKLRRQQQQEAIKKAQQQKTETPAKEPVVEEPEPIAGNVITSGTSLKGLDRIQMARYNSSIKDHVHGFFEIPSFLNNVDLKASADIKIDRQGYVIFRTISSSSGNQVFDDAVLTAIDRSSPLPAPPDRLQKRLEHSGFRLGFPEL